MLVNYAAHVRIHPFIPTEKIHHNQLIVEIRDKIFFIVLSLVMRVIGNSCGMNIVL